MISEGCDINLVDWYGSLSPNQTFNLATANTVFADLNSRSGYPLRFGILEDKGALKYSCPTSGLSESATVSCLQNALTQDMDYINTHYANSAVYWTDAGQPVIAYFRRQRRLAYPDRGGLGRSVGAVKAHTDVYAAPFKFVFQFGSFTTAPYDNGRFAWVQPPAYSSTQQFWWGSNASASPTYLDNFYTAGLSHPSQLAIGALYKGFDDNNASGAGTGLSQSSAGKSWSRRQMKSQNTSEAPTHRFPMCSSSPGTTMKKEPQIEDGVDNCYTVNASLSGNNFDVVTQS